MRLRSPATTALAFVALAVSAVACTIPVFRYALDRWPADAFRLVVPAAMAKQPDIAKLLVPLIGNPPANIKIETAKDASIKDAQLLFGTFDAPPIWSGAVNAESLQKMLESPARADLIKRILAGESVIWVFADNGTPEDKTEFDRIAKRLRYLQQVVALPPQDPNDPDSQLGNGPPLKLELTAVRVSMKDEAEKLFCAMLAGTKCADALAKGEPFASPVFGRGRVLGSFPLKDLDDAALEDITMFLTGRCSCRVKNQSPGWDVLLKVDWDSALEKAQTDVPVVKKNSAVKPEAVRIEPKKQ